MNKMKEQSKSKTKEHSKNKTKEEGNTQHKSQNKEAPFDSSQVILKQYDTILPQHTAFIAYCSKIDTTTVLLDPLLTPSCRGYIFSLLKHTTTSETKATTNQEMVEDIYGFVMATPFEVSILSQIKASALVTHNIIRPDQRGHRLVKRLVGGIIDRGKQQGRDSAYFFVPEPLSSSAIKVYALFRPLNVDKCLESGYGFGKSNLLTKLSTQKQKEIWKQKYSLSMNPNIQQHPTELKDFSLVKQTKLQVHFTLEDFQLLNAKPYQWNTWKINDKVMVTCHRTAFIINKNNSKPAKAAILLYLNANIVNVDMIKHFFGFLQSTGLSVVHAVSTGIFASESIQKELEFLVPGPMYFDTYGFDMAEKFEAADIHLLYN